MTQHPVRPLATPTSDLLGLENVKPGGCSMKHSIVSFQRCVGAFLMSLLAACGGGGGGSGDGGAGNSSSSSADAAVFVKSGATIRDVTYEGLPIHQASLELGLEGDLAGLRGRTLYLALVDPARIFVASNVFVPADSANVSVSLNGAESSQAAPGRRNGTMQLLACLDPGCTTQLRNSPLAIDYQIDVLAGITLSTDVLDVRMNFGDPPPSATMTIAVPAGAGSWLATPIDTVAGASESSWSLVPQWLQRTGNTLTLQPPSNLLPGVYALQYQVETALPDPRDPNVPQRLVKRFVARHTVVATGVYSMSPSSESIVVSAITPLTPSPSTSVASLVSQVGGTFLRRGVRTDAAPAAATGDPLLADWLSFTGPDLSSLDHEIRACDIATNLCLPVGTYQGALLMRHTAPDGTQTDFEFPVTFRIDP